MAIETLGAALRQINRLFGGGTVTGLSDAQLLDRFLAERDAASFEALVARHGPMVPTVCRGVLRDPNDAEDAFQATFLILVKKAGTIRGRSRPGRLAVPGGAPRGDPGEHRRGPAPRPRTGGGTDDRRVRDRPGRVVPDDLLPALHEEIARLPEKYRLPVVLCDLEGMPQAEAAGQLHWSERTLRRRLAEARDRLKGRLARRGLAPDGAALGAVFLREARAAVPPAWNAAAVRAALHAINPPLAAGTVSAAAQSLTQEVLKTMLVQKLTIVSAALLGAGLMAWAASAALISRGDEPAEGNHGAGAGRRGERRLPRRNPRATRSMPSAPSRSAAACSIPTASRSPAPRSSSDTTREFGRSAVDPDPDGQKGRVTVSDADGRFRFDLDKASSDWPYGDEPAWHGAQIAAVAPGLARGLGRGRIAAQGG